MSNRQRSWAAIWSTAGLILMVTACTDEVTVNDAGAGTSTGMRFLSNGDDNEYAHASDPVRFEFPRDHGQHSDFRTEWWYFVGNLFDSDGRHFGFELTFFRYALSAVEVERKSNWSAGQAWMAHLALTDTMGAKFYSSERLARGAMDLAGASDRKLDVWVHDWSARELEDSTEIELTAADSELGLRLRLNPLKPPIANGSGGIDAKGPEIGNASYYYSQPRLSVVGEVSLPGHSALAVSGSAWLDREWGTAMLSPGIEGWDWFAIQLNDGNDLMLYRLRTTEGRTSPFSSGTLFDSAGKATNLSADEFHLEAAGEWVSTTSRVRYPVRWNIRVPDHQIDISVIPVLENQEIDHTVRYWEGAVTVSGSSGFEPVSGRGYLELAGYVQRSK